MFWKILIGVVVFLPACLLLFVILVYFISYFPMSMLACVFRWLFEKDEYDVFLTFKEFYDYYLLNPEGYRFEWAKGVGYENEFIKVERYSGTFRFRDITIGFKTPLDYYRFYKWRKKVLRDKETEETIATNDIYTRKFVELVQQDIDNLRAKSNKELEEAKEMMKGVKNEEQ